MQAKEAVANVLAKVEYRKKLVEIVSDILLQVNAR